MFYYKTSILLFNCFLFPHIFLHQGKYIIIFSLPLRTGQAHLRYPCLAASTFSAGCIMSLRLRSPLHHAPVFCFLPLHTRQAYLRYPCLATSTFSAGCIMSLRLRSPLQHAPVFPFSLPLHKGQAYLLRRYPCLATSTLSPHSRLRNVLRSSAHTVSLPLRSGNALTQALLRNPCPLPPRSPAPPIYFFSKFSSLCGSTGSLKSAFIIKGFQYLPKQVSPKHLKTHFVDFETLRLT